MKSEKFSTNRLNVKIIIGGIEMGEVIINEGEKLDIVPVDCYLAYNRSDFLGEHHGLASDGVCIQAYKELDDVIAQPEHANFSEAADPVANLVAAIDASNALYSGVQQDKNTTEMQVVEEPKDQSPSVGLLHPDVQQLIADGKLQVGVGGIEAKASVVDPRAMGENVGSPPHTPPLQYTETKNTEKIEFQQNTPVRENTRARVISARKKAAGPVPADYISASQGGQMPKGMVEYAQKKLGKDASENVVRVLLENFVDHHLKTGKLWVDWMAAWRTWIRNEKKFRQERGEVNTGITAPAIIDDSNREALLRD